VLAPTTLLAQQHFQNFRDRLADWPIRVEVLSRFKSKKETAEALAKLADGQIDIMIGTHKLLQPDVKFKDLGLLIVDEEQRFGVRQKEQLKKLRAEVDLLTLTATPIRARSTWPWPVCAISPSLPRLRRIASRSRPSSAPGIRH
jgi:transcription-repair coupling factor (superfamily II helicase)